MNALSGLNRSMQRRSGWVGLLFGLLIGIWLIGWSSPAYALTEEQKLVNEAWRVINRAYVDNTFHHQNWSQVRQQILQRPLNNREEAYTAIQEMLATLDDPFTRLLRPDQYRSLQTSTSGELTGVGLQIALESDTGHLQVIAPIEGSPAEKAGVHPGDRIVAIDGVNTKGLTLDEAAARMRGPLGSRVTLTVKREGQESLQIDLTRNRITINPVYADCVKNRTANLSDIFG
ncbi:MAG: PDZ domain-containing protein [Leptolyngbyaceae cyanobacterium bins.59]|nr:PDZ domain-containing protein [Leptolyngbyaceae cyanobacterium bins.59]